MKSVISNMLMVAIVCSVASLGPVEAQSRQEFKEMETNIQNLEKQLRAVQRKVFQGDGSALSAPSVDGEPSSLRTLLADMEVRLGVLDRQVRDMTGKFEEFEHNQSRLMTQMDLLRKDMDMRFSDMKGGQAAPQQGNNLNKPVVNDVRQVQGAVVEALDEPEVAVPALSQNVKDPRNAYNAAFSFVRKGDFDAAEASLKAFLVDYPKHELAGNAQYWLGETYYARRDYPRAASAFLAGFKTYAQSSKGPDSLLKLGLSLYGMGKQEEACSALSELPVVYPSATDAMKQRSKTEYNRIGCK